VIDTDDESPPAGSDESRPGSGDDDQARPVTPADAPTATTPLGAASLWRDFLRDAHRHRQALDRLAVKPERWGDYTWVAARMSRLSFADMPVTYETRSREVAWVRCVGGDGVDWFLTTVRGGDGLWRVWDLTERHRPSLDEVCG
jgi:hypothetical protein